MARYLLDTNVLVYMILNDLDNLSNETINIIFDYNNLIYTSSVAVIEMCQLYRLKKISSKDFKNISDLLNAIENDFNIKILPFSKTHTETLSKLKIVENHNDPFDHAIISHAITDKLILVSSDGKFKEYASQKLNFSFNAR